MEQITQKRLIDWILEDLDFEPENLDGGESLEGTDTYKFIFEKVKNGRCVLNNDKLLAIRSISCQLYREDNYGCPEFDKDQIFDLLRDRDEKEYIELFQYYSLIPNLEIHKIHGIYQVIGTNFQLELSLFLDILSNKITDDLNIALEKVRKILIRDVKPAEWYVLFLGDPYEVSDDEDYETSEKERVDLIINSVIE